MSLLAALEYFESIGGYETLERTEHELSEMMAVGFMKRADRLRILGPTTARERVGVWSFVIEGIHPGDLADFFADQNLCVRAGLHCAEPLATRADMTGGSVRASLYLYNTPEDIERFFGVLDEGIRTLG